MPAIETKKLLFGVTATAIMVSAVLIASASTRSDSPHGQRSRVPGRRSNSVDLPNGWHVTPAGTTVANLADLPTNLTVSPDGKALIALNSGFLPHGIYVFDTKTRKQVQRIALTSTWLGLAWSADGHTFYVSGGNLSGRRSKDSAKAPIYQFAYENGRLSDAPTAEFADSIDPKLTWWSGVAYLESKHLLYAANRGTGTEPSNVVVFDTQTKQIVKRIPVEVTPYQTVLSADGAHLFVSNESSRSVSVIDTATNKVIRSLQVGVNPSDMKLSTDGRLFVACANDNTVHVIDTRTLQVVERLSTTLTPLAPEGSTPNALAIDEAHKLLYVANADNNSVAVVHIENPRHSTVVGFIPTGWYPSALALADHNGTLYVGNAKGEEGHPTPKGPHPLVALQPGPKGDVTVRSLQTGNLEAVPVQDLKAKLPEWTHQVINNTPYNDSLLSEAPQHQEPSVIPRIVGAASPIQHVIFIIKENRTYDQVFGDVPGTNGDPDLAIFGKKITPNQHALAKEYVTLDNLYCDGEVSMDGHSWSNAAYATDFNEKEWPSIYAGRSAVAANPTAYVPSAGFLWDLAKRKGLTYRSYGEGAARVSTGAMKADAAPGAEGLVGHVSPDYPLGLGKDERDTTRVEVFLREFKGYEENYDSPDPGKRLPNYIVMSMPEDHTMGTTPGQHTPEAMVANHDYAIGQLVDAVSHSRYWPNTAIFMIEDDAQDGSDHVDGRRTVGLVVSPYVKRGIVDHTLYSTSSMLRSMELLLGLPPMSQYDAAAMPMYASFGDTPKATPFDAIKPLIDVSAMNTEKSYGAKESSKMDFSQPDRAPMHALNEIIWKSVKGPDAVMPAPVHRFRPLIDPGEVDTDDEDADNRARPEGTEREESPARR